MSLERLAAGCIVPSFAGPERPAWLRPWLELGLGGVCLFATNVRDRAQLAALTAALREDAPGLVVALDEEGGDVTRLEAREGSSYPGALALGAVDDAALTERVAAAIGAELAAVGVNLDLAPVADVNTNPANPVIGVRAFGSEPQLVARHVAAFVAGLQSQGVAACAKHFPGHGDTRQDSHLELPVVAAPELEPFRAAVSAGARAVMTAHVVVSSLDGTPATLSPVVLGLLRAELAFDGAIVGDALDMGAIAATVGVAEGAVRALAAGVDAVCLGPAVGPDGVGAVHGAVLAAVRAGRLSEERLAEAAGRVAGIPLPAGAPSPPEPSVGREAAERALRSTGDVAVGTEPVVLELAPPPLVAAGETGASLGRALAALVPGTAVRILREGDAVDGALPAGSRVVLVLRDEARHPWQRRLAERVLAGRPDAVVVETGLPGPEPPGPAFVATHGAGRASLEAAARLLTGAS